MTFFFFVANRILNSKSVTENRFMVTV